MLARLCSRAAIAVAVLVAAVVAEAPYTAQAQEFPNKPIRFLQGFPAGGNADVIVRALGEHLTKTLGQPIIAEARPGASGNLATEQVVRAQPDGYQLVLLTTAHVISPALLKQVSFDAVKDLDFISWVADFPFFLAVHKDSPFKTVNELVEYARRNPDKLTWGSAGTGSGQHMSGEVMIHATKTKMRHVPFRGDAGSVTALLSKSVDFIMAPSTVLVGNIEGGNFRALAVSSKTRAPALKDVPTMAEALKLDIEMQAFNAVATTKGTPAPILARLTAAVHDAVKSPAMDKRLRDMGGTPLVTSNQDMAKLIAGQVDRWKKFIADTGIKGE
jgi:tripartite-type tricarboxylate transporter receptor subunit TctC